jgi:hypothetical protein
MTKFPFYPPLVAAFPVLAVYSANTDLLPLSDLWLPLLLSVSGTLAVGLIAAVAMRRAERGAMFASVVLGQFFLYRWWAGVLHLNPDAATSVAVWTALSIALASLAAWKIRATKLLNPLALLTVAVSVSQIAWAHMSAPKVAASNISAANRLASAPDVFYIVLDGFGREDQLARSIGFDAGFFIQALEARGFYVAPESNANYVQTQLSLASSLNMQLLQDLLPSSRDGADRGVLVPLISRSRVAREFASRGYTTIAVTSGFEGVKFEESDLALVEGESANLLAAQLLSMTPLRFTRVGVDSMFTQRRNVLRSALDALTKLASPAAKPRFVFAHIFAPHPPFVFGRGGQDAPRRKTFNISDGSHLLQEMSAEEYKIGYAAQAEYIAKRMIESVDAILRRADTPPIIIIQGDHGSKVGFDQESLEKTDLGESFGILNAYFAPDGVRSNLYPTITPVNSFRTVLANLFGLDLAPIPDRSYYSPYTNPFQYEDVTDRIELR